MKDTFQMFPTPDVMAVREIDGMSRLDRFAILVLNNIMATMPAASTSPEAIPRIANIVYTFADALEAEAIKREEKEHDRDNDQANRRSDDDPDLYRTRP